MKAWARLFFILNICFFVAADANALSLPFFCQKQLTGVAAGVFTPIPKKVLVIESIVGNGHQSATDTILGTLGKTYSDLTVARMEIESLKPAWRVWFELKVFWKVVNSAAWIYDGLFKREMKKAERPDFNVTMARQHVDPRVMLEAIEAQKPSVIIATSQHVAGVLATLRYLGYLKNVKIGFVFTDFFVGYFPEVSKQLDITFLPHTGLADEWIRRGVPPEKIAVTGMPIDDAAYIRMFRVKNDRDAYVKAIGLDPDQKLITLASGGEGVGRFDKIVKSLANEAEARGEKLQIIAVCAKSETNYDRLLPLVAPLAKRGITLVVHRKVPRADLLTFNEASDVVINKTGGLSPPEVFAKGTPAVLLDIYGGHERDNARFFEGLGVADINHDYDEIGPQVFALLDNSVRREEMRRRQAEFSGLKNYSKVSEAFAQELGTELK